MTAPASCLQNLAGSMPRNCSRYGRVDWFWSAICQLLKRLRQTLQVSSQYLLVVEASKSECYTHELAFNVLIAIFRNSTARCSLEPMNRGNSYNGCCAWIGDNYFSLQWTPLLASIADVQYGSVALCRSCWVKLITENLCMARPVQLHHPGGCHQQRPCSIRMYM